MILRNVPPGARASLEEISAFSGAEVHTADALSMNVVSVVTLQPEDGRAGYSTGHSPAALQDWRDSSAVQELQDILRGDDVELAATAAWTDLLSQALFRSALNRERERADRFGDVFALLTITMKAPATLADVAVVRRIVEGFRAGTRGTDLIGWLDESAVLGVILPGFAPRTGQVAGETEARIQLELLQQLDPQLRDRLELRWYIHRSPDAATVPGFADDDPLLATIRRQRDRRVGFDVPKRMVDVAGSVMLLAVLAPLLAVIAVLIKLTSSGPVLFRQGRVGRFAQPFTMLKFRTMRTDLDDALHQAFVKQFIQSRDCAPPGEPRLYKLVDDPRVTRFGRLLRKTSLDELPQLWNVLRGEMSLVGPRPPLGYELDHYRPWHWRRVLDVKPGMTGLWQVTGRSLTTFDEMVRLDLRYVASRSLKLDLRILLATPRAVLSGKGAW